MTPSVFAKGARVLREVTPKEMMVCFDIEEGTQKALLDASGGENLSREFVMEAPLKVLCRVGKWIQCAFGLIKVMTDKRPNPCDHSLPLCGKEALEEEVEGGAGGKRLGDAVDDPMVQKRLKNNTSTGAAETQELSQIATKSDDAPVDVEEWDKWSVYHYQPPQANAGKPLVCVQGLYCLDKHGRLFDALRRLLIRRVRHNTLRGLIRYMQNKHGSRLVETEVGYKKRKKKGQREDSRSIPPRRYDLDEGRRRICGAGSVRFFRVAEWALKKKLKGELKKACKSETLLVQRELHLDAKVGSNALG